MKKAYYKKVMSLALAGTLLMGLAPTAVYAAEPKKYKGYDTGGFGGTVRWEVNNMLGSLDKVVVPERFEVFNMDGSLYRVYLTEETYDDVVVVRPSEEGVPIASVKNIRNMKAMPQDSGWGAGLVWNDKVKAFEHDLKTSYYAVTADGSQINLYPGNGRSKLIEAYGPLMKYMEDKNGSYGGTMHFQYILLLSEEDEAYFLQHGVIPGMEGLKAPGLRELLLNPEPFVENAVRDNLQIITEDGELIEIDAFIHDARPYRHSAEEPAYFIKLRDLAQLVNGTEYQFNISWNNTTKCMEITTDEPYKSVGTELQVGVGNRWSDWVETDAIIDGKKVRMITDEFDQNYLKYTDDLIMNMIMIDGSYYTSLKNVEKYLKIPVEVVNGQMMIGSSDRDEPEDNNKEPSKRELELRKKGIVIPDPLAELPTPVRPSWAK